MTRHSCPGHPDCFVDCPNGGSAYFHEPMGPCDRACDDTDFGRSILRLSDSAIVAMRVSGTMDNFPVDRLASFTRSLAARRLGVGRDELRELLFLIAESPGERISASWDNVDLVELLAILGDAAGMGEPVGAR